MAKRVVALNNESALLADTAEIILVTLINKLSLVHHQGQEAHSFLLKFASFFHQMTKCGSFPQITSDQVMNCYY